MHTWIRNHRQTVLPRRSVRRSDSPLRVERLEDRSVPSAAFIEMPLVSNVPGLAPHTDPDLHNPWGFIETQQGQFRVSANGSGNAPLISADGRVTGPAVVLPPPPGSP